MVAIKLYCMVMSGHKVKLTQDSNSQPELVRAVSVFTAWPPGGVFLGHVTWGLAAAAAAVGGGKISGCVCLEVTAGC